MLACADGRDNQSIPHLNSDRVVFKNVRPTYKLRDKISVEYILSPKTKTSTHDYVGIYPRNWKNLREFVGFEYTITPPCEEPSLFRSIQFSFQPPYVTLLNQDHVQEYQFVYVTQSQEVLGKSDFFHILDNQGASSSDVSTVSNNCYTHQKWENVRVQLTPDEIAYNECYFRDQASEVQEIPAKVFPAPDKASRVVDETSNAQAIASQESLTSHELSVQQFYPDVFFKNRKGRALIKTRDSGQYEIQNMAPQSPPFPCRPSNSFRKNHNSDIISNQPYIPLYHQESSTQTSHQNLQAQSPWHHQPKYIRGKRDHTSLVQNDVKRGAIPKQCSKCRAPSDFIYQQQITQHQLVQAHEEVRDLRSEVERLKHVLELSEAGQAKLRVTAEIAKRDARYAISFLNNLMFSLVTQYKTKIVNFDNSVMYVTRELVSPGLFVPGGSPKTLVCGRPSNVKIVSGRDKELKAIIGRQELKIRDLHAKLCLANEIIKRANLLEANMKLELPDIEQTEPLTPPQLTSGPRVGSSRSDSNLSSIDRPSFDLTDLGEVLSKSEGGTVQQVGKKSSSTKSVNSNAFHSSQSFTQEEDTPQNSSNRTQEPVLVEAKFYPLEPVQFWNQEVITDQEESTICCVNDGESFLMPNETNNNNYVTTNMNAEVKFGKSKCSVCESSEFDTCDPASFHSREDLN